MASKRTCRYPGCTYSAMKRRQLCGWHWLARQPIETQEDYAASRLSKAPEPHRARVPAKEWPPGCRWCAGCQSWVPLWYTSGSRCKACASLATHRSRVAKEYVWPEGVTYDSLLELQEGRCAICRRIPRSRRLAVDHDHTTGLVRGLLCSANEGASCNKGLLGSAHDDVRILRNAVYYLENPPSGAPGQV